MRRAFMATSACSQKEEEEEEVGRWGVCATRREKLSDSTYYTRLPAPAPAPVPAIVAIFLPACNYTRSLFLYLYL